MTIASPLPFLLLMAAYLLAGAAIARFSGFYSRHTQPSDDNRFETLDGLRGLLAFAVFFHHARFTYQYYSNGSWEAPEGGLYFVLGPLAVALFFAITAFLFWGKAVAAGGQINPLRLFSNRVRRIAPMYLVSLAVIALILLVLARFQFSHRLGHLAFRSALMLCLGVFEFPEEYIRHTPVYMVNAGVYWTLRYEWLFYLALPFLALGMRRPKVFVFLVALFVAISALRPSLPVATLGPFVLGMCAAQLISWRGSAAFLRSRWVALLCVVSLFLVPLAMGTYAAEERQPSWRPITTLCISLPFLASVYGNDFFGLLRLRGAKVLGLMSYSVYLLHGIVLFVTMRAIHLRWPLHTLSPGWYWFIAFLCGLATLLLSALSYRLIEYPWLRPLARQPKAVVLDARSSVESSLPAVQ